MWFEVLTCMKFEQPSIFLEAGPESIQVPSRPAGYICRCVTLFMSSAALCQQAGDDACRYAINPGQSVQFAKSLEIEDNLSRKRDSLYGNGTSCTQRRRILL